MILCITKYFMNRKLFRIGLTLFRFFHNNKEHYLYRQSVAFRFVDVLIEKFVQGQFGSDEINCIV